MVAILVTFGFVWLYASESNCVDTNELLVVDESCKETTFDPIIFIGFDIFSLNFSSWNKEFNVEAIKYVIMLFTADGKSDDLYSDNGVDDVYSFTKEDEGWNSVEKVLCFDDWFSIIFDCIFFPIISVIKLIKITLIYAHIYFVSFSF